MICFTESELQQHEELIITRALAAKDLALAQANRHKDELFQKLAENDRELTTIKHDYAQLKEAYNAKVAGVPLGPIVGAQTIINQQIALAEKDREIAYLQECRTSAAAMDAQRAIEYQQLMEKAVKFAQQCVQPIRGKVAIQIADEAQAFLKEHKL